MPPRVKSLKFWCLCLLFCLFWFVIIPRSPLSDAEKHASPNRLANVEGAIIKAEEEEALILTTIIVTERDIQINYTAIPTTAPLPNPVIKVASPPRIVVATVKASMTDDEMVEYNVEVAGNLSITNFKEYTSRHGYSLFVQEKRHPRLEGRHPT